MNKQGWELLPFGPQAALVQFPAEVSPEINRNVIRLHRRLIQANLVGVEFLIPAYCSLTIGWDPDRCSWEQIEQSVNQLMPQVLQTITTAEDCRTIEIPVCYAPEFALDLPQVEIQTGISAYEIVALHQSTEYHVYMMGFLPGFAYLGSVPNAIRVPRKPSPRLRVAAGSVGIAESQTGIYPTEAPGGWQIIGRTPVALFSVQEGSFLLSPGDAVVFREISLDEFDRLSQPARNRSRGQQ